MIYKVRYYIRLVEIDKKEGINAIKAAAADPTKPLHCNIKQEPITSTKSLWYRFRPSKASKWRA
jgi:hypothetical protein